MVLEERAWQKERVLSGGGVIGPVSFHEFIHADYPVGLDANYEVIERLIGGRSDVISIWSKVAKRELCNGAPPPAGPEDYGAPARDWRSEVNQPFFDYTNDEYREPFDNPPSAVAVEFKTADFFCSEYVPLSYVVEPLIRTASIYTLTAKTGGGKTAFNVVLSLAVATGRRDILGLDVEKGRVAYLAFENPDDVRMRIMTASWLLSVGLSEIGANFIILDARAKPEEIVKSLTNHSRDGAFTLIIVDTFAAAFDGVDVNDNVQAGEFVRRLRPLTQMAGLPAVLIAAHPTKNASDEQIVPYGGGAILNEVDGNLTLTKKPDTSNTLLHWQGKFRGLEFSPISFRFELTGSPDVVDSKGRQVQLPTLRPCSDEDVEAKAAVEVNVDIAILKCLDADPIPSLREIAGTVGRSKSVVGVKLSKLAREKLVEKVLDQWRLTAKGRSQLSR